MQDEDTRRLKAKLVVNLMASTGYMLAALVVALLVVSKGLSPLVMAGTAILAGLAFYHARRAVSPFEGTTEHPAGAAGAAPEPGPAQPSAGSKEPRPWVLRSALYALTLLYVLPAIAFGAAAVILLLKSEWVGGALFLAGFIAYAFLGWQRLHGRWSYTRNPPIIALRRSLHR